MEGIISSLPIGVIISDTEGKVEIINDAAMQIWAGSSSLPEGWGSSEGLEGLHASWADTSEPLAPEDWPIFDAIREGKEQAPKVLEIVRLDGTRGIISVTASPLKNRKGRVIAGISIQEDITERYEASRELELTKARLEAVLDNIPAAIVIVEPPDGRCTYANKQMIDLYPTWNEQPASTNCFTDLPSYHLDGRAYDQEEYPLTRTLRSGHPVLNEVLEFERKDGMRGYANANAVPVRDSKERVIAVIGLRFDITAQVQAQKNLARSNAELQQFAYVASHDLQEPIRTVMNYLGLLNKKHGKELSPEAMEYLATAMGGAQRMRELVNDLLQYSRLDVQGKEFARVDMNRVVTEVLSTLKGAIDENHASIRLSDLPKVYGDHAQLIQVMSNLLSNAIKFRGDLPPDISIFSEQNEREDIIAVRDNGIGIDPKHHDKLFQMFQRLHTKEEYPGTGIGLAISKKIVERHGGRIWCESEVGKGSTFYVALPKRQYRR